MIFGPMALQELLDQVKLGQCNLKFLTVCLDAVTCKVIETVETSHVMVLENGKTRIQVRVF